MTTYYQLAKDLLSGTMHGTPPLGTTMALAEMVVRLDNELSTLRLEHEAHAVLLDCARRDRDEARAECAATRCSLFVSQKAWTEVDNHVRVLEPEVVLLRKERDEARQLLGATSEALDGGEAPVGRLPELVSSMGQMLATATDQRNEARSRLRDTAQILVAEVGADGPLNADEAAGRAVAVIADLRAQLAEAKTLGASLHKASAAGYDRCTADVVAELQRLRAGQTVDETPVGVALDILIGHFTNGAHVGAKERE